MACGALHLEEEDADSKVLLLLRAAAAAALGELRDLTMQQPHVRDAASECSAPREKAIHSTCAVPASDGLPPHESTD